MTVVVAYSCSDGAVIAADSMITPTLGVGSGVINVGHHHGIKVYVLPGSQLFAFAGDQGQAARFRTLAEANHTVPDQKVFALDYPLALTQGLIAQFQSTGIANTVGVNTILSFLHNGICHCCVFEGAMQPRLLDKDHYYVALGSRKLSADPFPRFLADIFCQSGQPMVREAVFLATWTVQHVIDVNPGGVAGPIRVAVFERNDKGTFVARELPDTEIEEHKQAIESAAEGLRDWRRNIQSGAAAQGVPQPPVAPQSAPTP
jgi:hypothetical protein